MCCLTYFRGGCGDPEETVTDNIDYMENNYNKQRLAAIAQKAKATEEKFDKNQENENKNEKFMDSKHYYSTLPDM